MGTPDCTGGVAYANWGTNFRTDKWTSDGWMITHSTVAMDNAVCEWGAGGAASCAEASPGDCHHTIQIVINTDVFSPLSEIRVLIHVGNDTVWDDTLSPGVTGVYVHQHSEQVTSAGDSTKFAVWLTSDSPPGRWIQAEGEIGITPCEDV